MFICFSDTSFFIKNYEHDAVKKKKCEHYGVSLINLFESHFDHVKCSAFNVSTEIRGIFLSKIEINLKTKMYKKSREN